MDDVNIPETAAPAELEFRLPTTWSAGQLVIGTLWIVVGATMLAAGGYFLTLGMRRFDHVFQMMLWGGIWVWAGVRTALPRRVEIRVRGGEVRATHYLWRKAS